MYTTEVVAAFTQMFVHFSDATYSLYTRRPQVMFVYFCAVHLLVFFVSLCTNSTVYVCVVSAHVSSSDCGKKSQYEVLR